MAPERVGCDCHSCTAAARIVELLEQLLEASSRPRALLTVDEAAGYLGVGPTTVRDAIAAGELQVVELGASRGAVRLAVADLDAYIETRSRVR